MQVPAKAKTPGHQTQIHKSGPLIFTTTIEKEQFTLNLAANVPCQLVALPRSKLRWRFEKHAKDMEKPLTSDAGFNTMIATLMERKKDRVVIITMPPPQETKENIVRAPIH